MILLNKRVKAKASWIGAYHNSFEAPSMLIHLHRTRQIQLFPYSDSQVGLKFIPQTNSYRQESNEKIVATEIARMDALDNHPSIDTHLGDVITGYLKRNAPLPSWAFDRVFPRSGSASTWFCVVLPHEEPVPIVYVDAQHRYVWKAANGIMYAFRDRWEADHFMEVQRD